MKRKLNDEQVPTPTESPATATENSTFASFGLDPRLLQAIAQEKFASPTLVQREAIPLALEGRDILARAKTGSGKTAVYLLPILEAILRRKGGKKNAKSTSALILVPTRELAQQVTKVTATFTAHCAKEIRAVNLTQKVPDAVQRSLLDEHPDIVISTPARASLNINTSALSLAKLTHLVVDEADLVLSYGHDEDLQNIKKALPQGVQIILTSATLTTEVEQLKGLFLKDPAVLELDEAEADDKGLTQYVVRCGEDEKFLLAYVIFKLQLIKGKCIIFTGDTDRCYRLKLFFEQFGIRSCVLNSELPVNSRIHVVEEFNKNVYDIVIAADDHEVLGQSTSRQRTAKSETADSQTTDSSKRAESEIEPNNSNAEEEDAPRATKRRKARGPAKKKDREYGISRGIDFQHVTCVLNFDLPATPTSYTHRIGRTARANQPGIALSFVIPPSLFRKHKPTSFAPAAHDESVLAQITTQQQQTLGREIKDYQFDTAAVEGFRYRMNDALRAVTPTAIAQARAREIRQELLKSEKLRRYFEENPADLRSLRHDGQSGRVRVQSHLKHVPGYLMPKKPAENGEEGGDVDVG
ncbi:MAG: hypothetical protein Q9191_006958, partial [Dirinaria sp. TL-2023a]